MIESWRRVFRDGFAPILPTAGLLALRDALATDDERLLQGSTTFPPPLPSCEGEPCEAGCPVSFCGWQEPGKGRELVGEVELFFANACFLADGRCGMPGACRALLNFWDDTPRPEAVRLLLPEVERELARRATAEAA